MKISVVIPCRNEVNAIEACVDAILSSEFSDKSTSVEILIVDGLSDDGTQEKLDQICKVHPSVKIISNPKQITPIAFNLGITNATGEYVQIVGARQFISPNYLQEAVNSFEMDPSIKCVGGKVENTYSNAESELIAKAMSSSFGVGSSNFRIKNESGYVDTVGTPMYPTSIFEEVGYFDEALVRNQDDEFNYRITQKGYKIFLNHNAIIRYQVRGSYKNLYNQYFQYGYWKVYVNKKVKAITTVRQLFPAILVASVAVGLLLSVFHYVFFFLWLFGVICYGSLCILFASLQADKNSEIVPITYVFLILHFSYGLGYLKGIFDFILMGKGPVDSQKKLSR